MCDIYRERGRERESRSRARTNSARGKVSQVTSPPMYRGRERKYVCVCARERVCAFARERKRESVCIFEREREHESVYLRERQREREREQEPRMHKLGARKGVSGYEPSDMTESV